MVHNVFDDIVPIRRRHTIMFFSTLFTGTPLATFEAGNEEVLLVASWANLLNHNLGNALLLKTGNRFEVVDCLNIYIVD